MVNEEPEEVPEEVPFDSVGRVKKRPRKVERRRPKYDSSIFGKGGGGGGGRREEGG